MFRDVFKYYICVRICLYGELHKLQIICQRLVANQCVGNKLLVFGLHLMSEMELR